MKKLVLAGLGAAILAAGAWYWLSPGIALHGLKDTALAGDKDALKERVDFPAVRESLKGQLRAVMFAEMAKEKDNPFAGLGMAFVSVVIDPMIDGMLSPEGIKAIVANGRANAFEGSGEARSSDQKKKVDWQIERSGFGAFVARPKVTDGGRAPALAFRRDGLGWDLVEIEVPVKKAAPMKGQSMAEDMTGRTGQ